MSVFRPRRPRSWPLVAAAFVAAPAWAEQAPIVLDDVVVTATRTKTKADQVGSSVTVVTAEEIEDKQITKVEDALRTVPGLSITRQGGMGSTSQIRIRGTDTNHTLVLVDGQRVNYHDTMYNFDFDWMQTDDIERIEVLRGPAAGQWGSDAVGGVVNIITKKGKGPMKVTALGELGSFGTNRESVSTSGGGDRYDYSFGWSRYRTAGWSTASEERGYGSEKDGSQNNTYHLKLGVSPTDNSEIEARYSHTDMWSELDGSKTPGTMDTMRSKHKHVDNGHLKGTLSLFDEVWTQTASVSGVKNDQWNMGGTTTGCTVGGPLCASYESTTVNASWQNDLRFHKDHTTTFIFEGVEDKYRQRNYQRPGKVDASMSTLSGLIQHQAHLFDVLDLTAGWRGNDHEAFGWQPTWFGSGAWHVTADTTLKASYGTTFKAPLLYQIHYPSGKPNPELQPEMGRGWDVGVEQKLLSGRAKTGLTWFRNDIANLIEYNSVDKQYQNVGKGTTYGIETFFNYLVFDDGGQSLSLNPNYTYTRAYDRLSGEELARRPMHRAGVDVNWRFWEKRANLTLSTVYSSDFQENRSTSADQPPNRHGEYVEFNLAGSYDINDTVQVFGRVENILDRYHESAWGYAETGGRGVFAGVKVSFEPARALTGDGE